MNEIKLNLARKWRSRNFEEIVGQDLSVRILKNSLFKGQYFPVYLFSGQRGCGKTSTARVFAAALNCKSLEQFQENPKDHRIPCLACESCVAMSSGRHPDFIEIDAASHTGVDNVRTIIESATMLPLMGSKKIYLIDEAHMLSKAAFNAFLKILEEPPSSALFILATTDPQKIIETVKSRCFQLFFKPIALDTLSDHLKRVCDTESIPFDEQGISLIMQESEGSARDALNILESVRFSAGSVTRDAVLQVLGHLDDHRLIKLFEYVLHKKPGHVLTFLAQIDISRFDAEFIWRRTMELLRALLWIKHGAHSELFAQSHEQLLSLAKRVSIKQIHQILELMYAKEQMFAKTADQHSFLEVLFLQLCQYVGTHDDTSGSSSPAQQTASLGVEDQVSDDEDEELDDEDSEEEEEEDEDVDAQWLLFLKAVHTANDPLLSSIFSQATFDKFEEEARLVSVSFTKEFSFFSDCLETAKKTWHPHLAAVYGDGAQLQTSFTRQAPKTEKKAEYQVPPMTQAPPASKPATVQKAPAPEKKQFSKRQSYQNNKRYARKPVIPAGAAIDVSDQTHWRKTHILLQHVPGDITEIQQG